MGGSKSIALSALTSPPLFSVAKNPFIPKVSFLEIFVFCGASVLVSVLFLFPADKLRGGGLISPPSALLILFSE